MCTIGVTLIPTLDIVIATLKVQAKAMKTQSESRETALLFV
jgi:hypothetical protein